jgi:aspartate carbamoyltransferase catalytic subunit
MKIKHFTHTSDFSKKDYLKVLEIAKKIEKRKNLFNLCRGKVLVVAFLKESTETLAKFQSAIIRMGGGWLGVTSIKGTYLESKEEDVYEFLERLSRAGDLIVIRGDNISFKILKERIKIPIINALGEDEHTISGLSALHFLKKNFKNLNRIKVGFYGMTGASRPAKAVYRVLSLFGVEIYEDSVIPELGIKKELISQKLKLNKAPLDEFISKIDCLFIVEGLPQAGTPENLVNEFNKKVKIIGEKEIAKLKKTALFSTFAPRTLTDGRLMVDPVIDKDPRRKDSFSLESIMATILYLLNIKI